MMKTIYFDTMKECEEAAKNWWWDKLSAYCHITKADPPRIECLDDEGELAITFAVRKKPELIKGEIYEVWGNEAHNNKRGDRYMFYSHTGGDGVPVFVASKSYALSNLPSGGYCYQNYCRVKVEVIDDI